MMRAAPGRLVSGAVLVLLLLVSLFLRLGLVGVPSIDFRPAPDAAEYAAAAVSLTEGRGLTLVMGGGVYPSRYPGGFPLVLAFFRLLGLPAERFYLAGLLLGLSVIPLVYLLGRRAGGDRFAALAAAAVTACSPVLIFCSIRVLTENLALVLLVTGFCLVAPKESTSPRRASLFVLLAGVAAGCAVTVRLANVVTLPAVFGLALASGRRPGEGLRRPALHGALFGAGALAGLLPQLLFNRANFGNLLTTGYGYWNQSYRDPRAMFEAAHAVHPWNPVYGNLWYYLEHLGGMTFEATFLRLYSLAAVLLAVAGLVAIIRYGGRRRVVHLFGLVHCLATLALLLVYVGQSTRLLVGVVPWLAIWAGAGAAALWRRPEKAPLRRVTRWAGALLLAAAVLPLFGWGFSRAVDQDRGGTDGPRTAAALVLERTPPGALIFSGLSPVYTGLLVDYRGGREVVQLSREDGSYVDYLLNASFDGQGPPLPQARFMPPLPGREPFTPLVHGPGKLDAWRVRQLRSALARGRPVFVLQNAEKPPFSAGKLAVQKFLVLRTAGRVRGALLEQVVRVRPMADRSLARTPLDLRRLRQSKKKTEDEVKR